jgi:hypothetical protein
MHWPGLFSFPVIRNKKRPIQTGTALQNGDVKKLNGDAKKANGYANGGVKKDL